MPLRGPRRGQPLRPTTDLLRERVFAVLGDAVVDAVVLDLFAGTGAVGFEALSRGAAHVTFVDSHSAAARIIERNARTLGVDGRRWRLIGRRATIAVRSLALQRARFDLVWIDPPFDRWRLGVEALAAVGETDLPNSGARTCLECPSRENVRRELPASVAVERELSSGASRLLIVSFLGDPKRGREDPRTQSGEGSGAS